MVLATAVPAKAPMKLNAAAMRDGVPRMQGTGRHGGRNRIRRIVESVDVVEDDGQDNDGDQQQRDAFHAPSMVARARPRMRTRRDRRPGQSRPAILRAMRLSSLFFTTLRDDPAEAEMPSHRLLLRAGYMRQLGSGIYSLLPLGFRVNKRVEQIVREEMDRIGCQEMEMPVVHPADVWRASGRYDAVGPEMGRFKDRAGRDMVLAMTHEEVVGAAPGRHRP